jgi:hypothetical protein
MDPDFFIALKKENERMEIRHFIFARKTGMPWTSTDFSLIKRSKEAQRINKEIKKEQKKKPSDTQLQD